MITYRKGHEVDIIRLSELFRDNGYEDLADDFKVLFRMVENSGTVFTAWDFDYMVGFINTVPGENSVEYVLVDREYSDMEIEKELRERISGFVTRQSNNELPS